MTRNPDQKILFILGVAVFVAMLGVGSIVPFLSVYAVELGASGWLIGLIFSAFSLSRGICAPVVGVLSDRHGRKRFIILGLSGYVAAAISLMLAASAWELVINRLAQGIFAAMVLPVCLAVVADLTPPGQEGRYLGSFNTAFLLGFGIGPFAGGFVYDYWGMNGALWLMALTSLAAIVAVSLGLNAPAKQRNVTAAPSHNLDLYKDRAFLGLMLARIGMAASMGCFVAFTPLLAAELGMAQSKVGTFLGVNVILMVAMQRPAGILADRFPRLPLATGGLLLSGVCKAALAFSHSFWQLMALSAAEGLSAGLGLPAMMAMVIGRSKHLGCEMGAAMGAFTLALSIGMFFGPPVGGLLVEHWGVGGPLVFAGLASGIGAVAMAVMTGSAGEGLRSPKQAPVA